MPEKRCVKVCIVVLLYNNTIGVRIEISGNLTKTQDLHLTVP